MSGAMRVDPAARRTRRSGGEWRIWLGWMAAVLLHGGLLAAFIFTWPARLSPVPDASAISLLILPAAGSEAIRPKPAAETAVIPTVAPVKIANTRIARKVAPLLPPRLASSVAMPKRSAAAAPRGVVATRTVAQQDGGGFVAARPAAGSANQPPEYPLQAQLHGEQGDVLLSIHVLANGVADSVSVTQSSGYEVLDQAAAAAVWKWRFQPSTLSGRSVPSVIPYRIHFDLQDAKAD